MKYEIYEKKDKPDVVLLALGEHDGYIDLNVVDEHGNRVQGGTILSIDREGNITRLPNVSPEFGFRLDDRKRVIFG